MKTFDDFREVIGAIEIKVRHDELYLLPRLIIFFEAVSCTFPIIGETLVLVFYSPNLHALIVYA